MKNISYRSISNIRVKNIKCIFFKMYYIKTYIL